MFYFTLFLTPSSKKCSRKYSNHYFKTLFFKFLYMFPHSAIVLQYCHGKNLARSMYQWEWYHQDRRQTQESGRGDLAQW